MKKLPLLILIGMGSVIIKLKVLDQLFKWVVASVVLAVSLTSCSFLDRSGTSSVLPITLDIRPTFLCEGEEVHLSWEYPSPIDRRDTFTLLLTRRPGGLLGIPRPHLPVGSWGFVPRQPGLPGEVAETAITFTAILRPDSEPVLLNTQTATAVVIGSATTQPHVEVFGWGCDNARGGGGAGWSSVDYVRGQIASEGVLITEVHNLNLFPIRVGVRRGSEPPVERTIGVGDSASVFNGELYGAWQAVPEAFDSYGPDGCEEGVEPGGVLISDPDRVSVIVVPRPDVLIKFTLACQVL